MFFRPTRLAVDADCSSGSITDHATPLFTWAAEHSENGTYQTEYRITLTGDKGTAWDSGWVKDTRQKARYSGEPFRDNEDITWFVTLRDNLGNESHPAENRFSSARTGTWHAPWITTPWDTEGEAKYFLKEFSVKPGIRKATLHICGIGYHHVTVNGAEADVAYLQPAISNYAKNCYYVTLPVTDFLIQGENRLEVAVGEGWRRNNGKHHCFPWEIEFFGVPKLTAILVTEYENGEISEIVTDESWLCGTGGITYNNLFDGETFDERISPVYTEHTVIIDDGTAPEMKAQNIPPILNHGTHAPVLRTKVPGGYLFDFGINIAGICEITIPEDVPAGTKINVHYAENILPDGRIDKETLRDAACIDTFISDGRNESRIWRPRFVYHGFRYIFVEGWNGFPDAEQFKAIEIYTAVQNNSYFKCGSALVNAIQDCIVRTEKNNMHSIATDCPQRDERMGWLNDSTVRFEEMPYNFNTGRFFSKIMDDITAEQDENGAITCTAPFIYGQRPADPVCSSYLVAALENYLHCGDDADIQKHYEHFKAWNECLKNHSENGIVNYGYYGDWASPGDCCNEPFDGAQSILTPEILMSTGYHYYNYKLLEKFASILGKETEAKQHKKDAERIQKAFLDKWWNEKNCTVGRGNQGSQAFALWLGILPEEKRRAAAYKLHEAVAAAGYRITTGNLTTRYLIDMLCEYGYTDDAWKLLTREEYPSWGFMLQNGATTVWERFELKRGSGMNSHDHPMYGAVGYSFYSYLAGLKPGNDGWQVFTVKPCIPKELLYAECCVDTPYGDIYIKWQQQLGQTDVLLSVPFGCRAEVILPWGEKTYADAGLHDYHSPIL